MMSSFDYGCLTSTGIHCRTAINFCLKAVEIVFCGEQWSIVQQVFPTRRHAHMRQFKKASARPFVMVERPLLRCRFRAGYLVRSGWRGGGGAPAGR